MLKLSIIIPMYNVEKYIERCLLSCLRQDISYNEYEIIIVNDGSPDCSLIIAQKIADQYTNIRIISQENKGLSEARNTGIRHANGQYIWFVDSDDVIKENCLSQIIEQCDSQELELLAICAAEVINDKSIRKFSFDNNEVLKGVDVLEKGLMICCAPFTIYRRDFLLKNNLVFFPGIYYEDTEFSPRAYFYAKRVGFSNDILYYYISNPTSITRTNNPKKAFDRLKVIKSIDNFFRNDMKYKHATFVHNYLSTMLNSALLNFIEKYNGHYILKDYESSFVKELKCNSYIIEHLLKSSSLKFRVEGILFKLFPLHIIKFYRILKKIR